MLVLGFWLVLQFISGAATAFAGEAGGGVAWWAHIGGFVAGMVMIRLLAPRRPRIGGRGASPQLVEVIQPDGEVIQVRVDR